MNLPVNKKKIIAVLFALAFIILIVNVLINKNYKDNSEEAKNEISAALINQKFNSALYSLGLKEDWIILSKKTNEQKEAEYSYKVNVPQDLPIALLISEITNSFNPNEVVVKSKEERINGETIVKIFSGGKEKLKSIFDYNNSIKREAGSVSILLKEFNELNKSETGSILSSPEQFGVVLIPSKSNVQLAKQIRENHKEYAVLLNDEISDLEYKLSSGYSLKRLKNSIRSIIGSFGSAVFILVDDNSNFYNGPVFPLVKSELEKRKIKLINLSAIKTIPAESSENTIGDFEHFVRSVKGEMKALLLLSVDDYITVQTSIVSLRKIGYQFINPSNIGTD